MSEKKKVSFFEIWTRKGTKKEEESYDSGIILIGVLMLFFMLGVLYVCLMEGGNQ